MNLVSQDLGRNSSCGRHFLSYQLGQVLGPLRALETGAGRVVAAVVVVGPQLGHPHLPTSLILKTVTPVM